jgi:SagB-type dehydrogenase family enzyme
MDDLSLILLLTDSLTAKARHSGGDFYFRNVASAGALYPSEIYVATKALKGLDDGLYHFAIHHHGLCLLRAQDVSAYVVRSTQTSNNKAPILTFFLTAIFFRSAWKYRARSYRYHLLDTGHVAENLILALKALGLPCNLSYDFDDGMVNHLLGLDETKEVSLAVAHVPGDDNISDENEKEIMELPDEILNASRVSGNEIDYPDIREFHSAGTDLVSEVTSKAEMIHDLGLTPDPWTKNIYPSSWPEIMHYPEAGFHRRSRRNFIKEPVRQDCMMALAESLCMKDFANPDKESAYNRSLRIGFLAGHADGMAPGFYLLDTIRESIGLVAPGSFTERMARICLDQAWLANAALHFLFLADLEVLDRIWGARGYRYAMLRAGRMGERLYIAATAMGIGCCGIGALYDGEAAQLLGLNRASRLLYLVAVGPVKRA